MATDLTRLRSEYQRRVTSATREVYQRTNPAQLFLLQQRERIALSLLERHHLLPLSNKRILEVGCGHGGVLLEYLAYDVCPSRLHGVELIETSAAGAHKRLPHAGIACGDGQHLPYPDNSFDLVFQYTAFSSILDERIKQNMAGEMRRVLRKPAGRILWYDFWLNPTNPQTRGIRPSELRRLFDGCQIELHRTTLAPPITRRLIRVSWLLCALLENLKLFNTHYMSVIWELT